MSNPTLPKVTVIIPYREDRGWLSDAITSVNEQQYDGEIELLIVQGDCPVGENLNNGIAQATGQFITYLCDDDLLPPNAIADSVAAFAAQPAADFIHGRSENFDVKGGGYIYEPPMQQPTVKDLLHRNPIHGGTVMYRTDFFEHFGKYDTQLLTGEEYELHLRALHQGAVIGYVDAVVYRYRLHPLQKHKRHIMPNGERREVVIQRIKDRYSA